jgi:hypothetical protein
LFLTIITIRKTVRQTARRPAGSGRHHRIDIIAKKADKFGTTGVASYGNEQLVAGRAPTNIHRGAPSVVGNISTLYAAVQQLTGSGSVKTII